MNRNIVTISATALAAGALFFAPLAAGAAPGSVAVTATVPSTITVTATTAATTNTWTGAAIQAVPFSVTVQSNDPAGYVFTFTTANGANFNLLGTGGTVSVPYTVTGADAEVYTSGTLGTNVYPGPTTGPTGDVTDFTAGLPVQANVPTDTYSDTLTVVATVNAT